MVAAQACHVPSGASTKQISHYAMLIKYDYFGGMEPDANGKYINYILTNIRVPVLLFHSECDDFIKVADVDKVYNSMTLGLKTADIERIERETIAKEHAVSHFDYFAGMKSPELVYDKIAKFFAKHRSPAG